jgi:ABC-2 type transport system ATP-binding protein
VEVEDLTLRYGEATALDDITVSLDPGKICGLIGRNGSGKTSLLSVLAAFRPATAGSVRVAGEGTFENDRITRQICLIREGGDVFGAARCADVLGFASAFRPYWDQRYAERLLDRFALPRHARVRSLSRGQRSALACTLGLASRAPLTVFDESYLGMDAPSRYAFYDEVLADYAAHPRTIIIATHLIEEFGSLFEEVVVIHRGRLLLHEGVDDLSSRGSAVTGPVAEVDRFIGSERSAGGGAGLPVLAERRLGGTKSTTIYGPLGEDQRRRARADGLQPTGYLSRDGILRQSVWEGATTPTSWLLFAGGIACAMTVPVFVAHGVTRRTVTSAAGLLAPIVATAGAVYMAAGYLLERAIHPAGDPRLSGTHLFERTSQIHLMLTEHALLFAGYFVAGWLVSTGYYRFGMLRGTLLLPVTLLPLAGVEVAMDTHHWAVFLWWRLTGEVPVLLSVALAMAVVFAGYLAVRGLSRAVPVQTRTS